jgi:hypothetical protein
MHRRPVAKVNGTINLWRGYKLKFRGRFPKTALDFLRSQVNELLGHDIMK